MLGTLLGTIAGRSQGGSGVKGALIGTIAPRAIRALGPIGTVAALGYAGYKGYQKWSAKSEVSADKDNTEKSQAALGSAAVDKTPVAA